MQITDHFHLKVKLMRGEKFIFKASYIFCTIGFQKDVPSYNLINISGVWEDPFPILSPTLRHKLFKWASPNYLNLFWKCRLRVSERMTAVGIEAGELCNMPHFVDSSWEGQWWSKVVSAQWFPQFISKRLSAAERHTQTRRSESMAVFYSLPLFP